MLRVFACLPITVALCCFAIPPDELRSQTTKGSASRLIVHEWGTFTELQNDKGVSLPRVNTDDEPVPGFVHGFGSNLLKRRHFGKRLPFEYNDLTVRLETPVIYFYPPATQDEPLLVDVHVGLRDGWLSEFYPAANYTAPGFKEKQRITPGSLGTLSWNNLKVGTNAKFPATDEAVWLHPRNTRSATVTSDSGESEKYLFYRGVGEFSGPLVARTNRKTRTVFVEPRDAELEEKSSIPAWLVNVREDGVVAFSEVKDLSAGYRFDYRFSTEAFTAHSFQRLRESMHAELVRQGLYHDEADAMLSTWNHAYFQSPGLRLFYVVPKNWVEHQMPLTISGDAEVSRVMIGRIELINETQRSLIEQLKLCKPEDPKWMQKLLPRQLASLQAPRLQMDELDIPIPPAYSAYLNMGRFRDALLHAEIVERPNASLHQFMEAYGLRPAPLPTRTVKNGQQSLTLRK